MSSVAKDFFLKLTFNEFYQFMKFLLILSRNLEAITVSDSSLF
jgi:hypothetical protein